ncbi:MAG: hypothetical protein WCZ68_05335 [Sedimentibacter sp.]
MKNRQIYIILTRTNTVLSNLISLIKNDEYTHASISLDKDLNTMYSFGRKHTYNPFVGCFVKENLYNGVFRFHNKLKGQVLKLKVTGEQYDEVTKLLYDFVSNSNYYKYNYLGLINSLLNRESFCDDRFLCSEFVYYVLNKVGIADLDKPRNLVRPQDLLNITSEIVFEGNLKSNQFTKDNRNKFKDKYATVSPLL